MSKKRALLLVGFLLVVFLLTSPVYALDFSDITKWIRDLFGIRDSDLSGELGTISSLSSSDYYICGETDSGRDYYNKGVTTEYYGSSAYVQVDSCLIERFEENRLIEYYCENDRLTSEVIQCDLCESGKCIDVCAPDCLGKECGDDGCGGSCGICGSSDYCEGGQCVVLPITYSCTDTDLGKDYYIKGTATEYAGSSSYSQTDYCVIGRFDTYLREYYCENDRLTSEDHSCYFYCEQGKCANCTETCANLGFECGIQEVCRNNVNCGTCPTGELCQDRACVCTDELGCTSEGSFCEGNTPYSCTLESDGCLDKTNLSTCSFNEQCLNGVCEEIPECTQDEDCSLFDDVCSHGYCDYYGKCVVNYATGSICRDSVGECDKAESCQINLPVCPNDEKKEDGASCIINSSRGQCSEGTCIKLIEETESPNYPTSPDYPTTPIEGSQDYPTSSDYPNTTTRRIIENEFEIKECKEIDKAGRYFLVQDLTEVSGNCIEISADNVELNCNGHSISGTDLGTAISSSADFVTIKNCVISGSSARRFFSSECTGIDIWGVSNYVTQNFVSECYTGIEINGNTNSIISNSVSGNAIGINVGASDNHITDNSVTDNTKYDGIGILVDRADNTRLINNMISRNTIGIKILYSNNIYLKCDSSVQNLVSDLVTEDVFWLYRIFGVENENIDSIGSTIGTSDIGNGNDYSEIQGNCEYVCDWEQGKCEYWGPVTILREVVPLAGSFDYTVFLDVRIKDENIDVLGIRENYPSNFFISGIGEAGLDKEGSIEWLFSSIPGVDYPGPTSNVISYSIRGRETLELSGEWMYYQGSLIKGEIVGAPNERR